MQTMEPCMNEGAGKLDIDEEINAFRERYELLSEKFQNLKSEQGWHTPCEICFSFEGMTVREFLAPSSNNPAPKAILIVYSHVNLPYVIDLTEQHSLVSRLIEAGRKVYLVDWGEMNGEARSRDLSVYLHDYIDKSIDFIIENTGIDQVDLMGICQGGTFSLCYASLHPEKIRSLITMVTPVDFHAGESVIWKWARKVDFSKLEERPVNIPGSMITLFFQSLRPFDEMMRNIRVIQNPESLKNLNLTVLIDRWVFECPDQPGLAFAQFMRQFYQKNKLVRGEFELGGHLIDLRNIACPVLNLYATADHLVPPESASALKNHIPHERYSEITCDGGHIGLMVGTKARRAILPKMAEWLVNNHKFLKDGTKCHVQEE